MRGGGALDEIRESRRKFLTALERAAPRCARDAIGTRRTASATEREEDQIDDQRNSKKASKRGDICQNYGSAPQNFECLRKGTAKPTELCDGNALDSERDGGGKKMKLMKKEPMRHKLKWGGQLRRSRFSPQNVEFARKRIMAVNERRQRDAHASKVEETGGEDNDGKSAEVGSEIGEQHQAVRSFSAVSTFPK